MSLEKFEPDNGRSLSAEENAVYELVLEAYMDEALPDDDIQNNSVKTFDLTSAPVGSRFITYHMANTPGQKKPLEFSFTTSPLPGRKYVMPGEPTYARINRPSTHDLPKEFFIYGACEDGRIDFTERHIGKITLLADLLIKPVERVAMSDFDPDIYTEALEDGTVIYDEGSGKYIYLEEGNDIVLPPVLRLSHVYGNNNLGRPLRADVFKYDKSFQN